ncbi:MAG: pseudouridine synthase [Erysipelotrichales bacterium]
MERLQKVIAAAGICSRRKAEELIVEGKVKVNGEVVDTLGTKVSSSDIVIVNGKKIKSERKQYYVMFKPKSVISSTSDDKGRVSVIDLLDNPTARLYPVGRLDFDTTGILLLTNDGEFANKMMHPSSKLDKTYIAFIDGILTEEKRKQLEAGVVFDGQKSAPAKVKVMQRDYKLEKTKVKLIIHEGRYHQVKMMFDAVGLSVRKLHREKYGHINLNGLVPGEYRKLKPLEISQLIELAENGFIDY